MAVYGYVRVSTMQQAEAGESLAVQQRQIEGYCIMHGLHLDRLFIERGVSGAKPLTERPEGSALLATVLAGDTIIAAKLDRVFRSALDALQMVDALKAKGVHLHLLDLGGDIAGNGLSRLFLTIAAAFAEAERDRIRERVKVVKADQKARGQYLGGGVPFGWRVVEETGELAEDPAQQAAIATAVRMRRERQSYRAIAAALTAAGTPVSHQTVKAILAKCS